MRIPEERRRQFYDAFHMATLVHRVFDKTTSDKIARKCAMSGGQIAEVRDALAVTQRLIDATAPGAPEGTIAAPNASLNFGPFAYCGNLIHRAEINEYQVIGWRDYGFFERKRSLGAEFCAERKRFHAYALERHACISALLAAVDATR